MKKENVMFSITILFFIVMVFFNLACATGKYKWVGTLFDGEDSPLLEGTKWLEGSDVVEFLSGGKLKYGRYDGTYQRIGNNVTLVWDSGFYYFKGIYDPEARIISGTYESGFSNYKFSKHLVLQSGIIGGSGIERALARAAIETVKTVPVNATIAIVYITALDRGSTDFITGELEYIWVNNGYIITDRSQLDRLREEQNFQLSGEIDDATAISIGKIAGADFIVTGRIDGEGDLRRLRLRAINTETAQVVGSGSERF